MLFSLVVGRHLLACHAMPLPLLVQKAELSSCGTEIAGGDSELWTICYRYCEQAVLQHGPVHSLFLSLYSCHERALPTCW